PPVRAPSAAPPPPPDPHYLTPAPPTPPSQAAGGSHKATSLGLAPITLVGAPTAASVAASGATGSGPPRQPFSVLEGLTAGDATDGDPDPVPGVLDESPA